MKKVYFAWTADFPCCKNLNIYIQRNDACWVLHFVGENFQAQSTPDATTQIRTQNMWYCLRAMWTLPFTTAGSIYLRLARKDAAKNRRSVEAVL